MLREEKKKVGGGNTCIQRWEGKGSAWAAAVQRDLLWAMTFPLSLSSLFQSLWDHWAGSEGVLNVGAKCIPAHPAPLPKPPSGKTQLQLKHFQRKILCALPPPHLCHEQGVRCRCLGNSSYGAWQGSWVGSMWGLGCSPPPLDLGVIVVLNLLVVCCPVPEWINHLYLKTNTCG